MPPAPLKIGLYAFRKMTARTAEPAILTLWPGYLRLEYSGGVIMEGPAPQFSLSYGRASGACRLAQGQTTAYLAVQGTPTSEEFPPAVVEDLHRAQLQAAADPQTGQLRLAREPWIGCARRPTRYSALTGTIAPSSAKRQWKEAKAALQVGRAVRDALVTSGVGGGQYRTTMF